MSHALVIGKFYPPHAGHHHLVDTAAAAADAVTVLVLAGSAETIPWGLRVAWMRERHPSARVLGGIDDTPVDYDDPDVWDAHVRVFRALCPEPVDLVVTSEAYGPELARRFGAEHLSVDPARDRFPVSGTAVRADPPAHWSMLGPGPRAHLTRRIAIVGAESTGTTTLAAALARRYATVWVPEHGRAVTQERVDAGAAMDEIAWTDADFERIAGAQQADEDRLARDAGPVLICDTDALATCLWQERYRGAITPAVRALADARHYSLYVLTGDEIPFVQDGLRDGEHVRYAMHGRFRDELAARPEPWLEVAGSVEERVAAASAAIDATLAAGWSFGAPP